MICYATKTYILSKSGVTIVRYLESNIWRRGSYAEGWVQVVARITKYNPLPSYHGKFFILDTVQEELMSQKVVLKDILEEPEVPGYDDGTRRLILRVPKTLEKLDCSI